jgi:type I restriction enzyme S subunit
MRPEQLLQHFDRIIDAPDAVPLLRRFILDLAVRGKLVEQDPADEPATELLKRIEAERDRFVRRQMLRERAPLRPIAVDDLPFQVPTHWEWLRLCEIGTLTGGMTPSKNQPDYWGGKVNWFSPKDIKSDEITDSELKITSRGLTETGLQLYPPGCLFMVARSGILKRTFPVSINRIEAAANQDLKILKPFANGLERYLQIMFRGMTDFVLSRLVKTGTTVQSLKYEEFEAQPLPLPPLAEQHRIVAKVDELMALCDALEARLTATATVRRQLLEATIHEALGGGS